MLHFPSKPKQWPDGVLGKGERADKNREERETKYGFKDTHRTEGQKHRGTDFQGRQTNMSLSGATAALAADQLHTGGGMRQHLERVVELFAVSQGLQQTPQSVTCRASPSSPCLHIHFTDSFVCFPHFFWARLSIQSHLPGKNRTWRDWDRLYHLESFL